MICPICNTANRDDARFCKGCGKRLPEAPTATATSVAAADTNEGVAAPPAPVQSAAAQQAVSVAPTTSTSVGVDEDISLAPTQILTPEQMIAINSRRWQQEAEQAGQVGNTEQAQEPSQPQPTTNAPTATNHTEPAAPATASAPAVQGTEQDVADMPTIIMAPSSDEEHVSPPPSAPSAASESGGTAEAVAPAATETEAGSAAPPETKVPAATNETTETPTSPAEEESGQEGEVAQTTQAAEQSEPQAQEQSEQTEQPDASATFSVLPVGEMVIGRYEVVQVVSEGAEENVYQVVDRQGYQRCWNCGSTQNAEGDEFCIDCGAELLNCPYNMHEYPSTGSKAAKDAEAAVLHGTIANTFMDGERTYVIEQPQIEQNAFPNGVHLVAATDSDAGNVRRSEPNEDSTLALLLERVHESISLPVGVFIVADGLGGHDNGQLASRVAINIIADRVVRDLLAGPLEQEKAGGEAAHPSELDEEAAGELLRGAVADANDILVQMNQRDKTDMGSTLTGFMIVGEHAYIVNVGDSRTYMVRAGQIYQLTTDHSLVGQLVAGGLIQPEDVYTHPQRSQIFRSLGDKHNVQIDIFKQQLHPGDILISCSDGLWEMVRNPQIESILNQAPNPQVACSQLIEAANTNGGEDNVSAVIVFVY